MSRQGKIARLPKDIREELNRRLDNGEPGIGLIDWLNGLPEVKKVLDEDFEGVAISQANLTHWKQGGFVDWQARQEARGMLEEWQDEEGDSDRAVSAELAEKFTPMLTTHYIAAIRSSNGDEAEAPGERAKRLGKSLRVMVRLNRCDLARQREREHSEIGRERLALVRERERERTGIERERVALARERLELERQKTDEGQRKKFLELSADPKIHEQLTPKMTPEEITKKIREVLDRAKEGV